MLDRVMVEVDGVKDVHFSINISIIALAHFESRIEKNDVHSRQRRHALMQRSTVNPVCPIGQPVSGTGEI